MSTVSRLRLLKILIAAFLITAPVGFAAQPADSDQFVAAEVQENSSAKSDSQETKPAPVQEKSNTRQEEPVYLSPEEYKAFLQWQKEKNAQALQRVPDYSVTSVDLNGAVDDANAALEATIQVQVNSDGKAVLVPLGLNEATLTKSVEVKSDGKGTAFPGGSTRESGYRWWFEGKGRYELKLQFLVPIRKTVPTRRLLLSLPQTAVSHLQLQIPQPKSRLKITPPEKSAPNILEKQVNGQPGTVVELFFGLEDTLDLQWQLLTDRKEVPPSLQVKTEITAKQLGESILLTADQTILTRQGSFEEFGVRLPPGFKLIGIEGERYFSNEVDPNDPSHVIVQLTEPTTEQEYVYLTWTLEKIFPQKGGELILEGFQVDQARRESGEISIVALEGFNINKRDTRNKSVHRTKVKSTDDNGKFQTAYSFLEQPFRLVVDLEEIAPRYSSEPKMTLHLTGERAELEAAFQLHVYRGAVEELELRWPNRKAENWDIEFMQSPDLIGQVQLDEKGGGESIHVRLVSRKTGRFELPLKATRAIQPGEDPLRFSLPRIAGAGRLPAALTVTHADDVEFVPATGSQTSLIELPSETRQKNTRRFRLDPKNEGDSFSAKVAVHEQSIQTDSVATLKIEEDRLQVEQQIRYEISYVPLSQIRLIVSKDLGRVAKFYTMQNGEEVVLDPTWSDSEDEMYSYAGFMLDVPTIGEYVIVARFDVPLPDEVQPDSPQSLSLPLIASSGVDYSSGRIQFRDSTGIELSVDNESWTRGTPTDDYAVWENEFLEQDVPLTLTKTSRRPTQSFSISRALIRSTFDQSGRVRSRAQYRIRGGVKTISLFFPPGTLPEEFWWDDRQLVFDSDVLRDKTVPGEYRLVISEEAAEGDFLLTVSFHSEAVVPFVWNRPLEVQAPRFPEDMWVEQTLWEVTLPHDQHLSINPRGFNTRFHWERGTVFWSRASRPDNFDAKTWIAAGDGPLLKEELADGNRYLFSRFGPTDTIRLYSLSRALVVLFGAGLALAAGFVLKKIKPLRSVMTLLVLALLIAAVGLWYVEPVKLLMQPALLGLLLATLAASVEGYLKRRRRQPILTLSSPSDFISPASGSTTEHPLFVGAGSEEPTSLRSGSESSPEPVSSSESGHGGT